MSIRLASLRGRVGVLRRVTRKSFLIDFGELNLVSIVDQSLSLGPHSLSCDSSRLSELEPDDDARMLDDAILLGWARLPFEGATLFDPSLRVEPGDRLFLDSVEDLLSNVSVPATYRRDCDRILHGDFSTVLQLAGKGEGSTPFGDDLLVGIRAAMHLRQLLGMLNCLTALDKELGRIDETITHPLSVSMIHDALAGDYPEALLGFAGSLIGKCSRQDACRQLRLLGSSSGDGMLWGMVRGILAGGAF